MKKAFSVLLAVALLFTLKTMSFAAKDTLIVADEYDATTLDPIRHYDGPRP